MGVSPTRVSSTDAVRFDRQAARQNLQRSDLASAQHRAQRFLAVFPLFDHLERAHAGRRRVPGQIGDPRIQLAEPVPRGVVAHQARTHHRAVRVDQPLAGRPHRAVVGLRVRDRPLWTSGAQHGRPAGDARGGQRTGPQAGFPDLAVQRHQFDLRHPRHRREIQPRRGLHRQITPPVGVDQLGQRGHQLVRMPAPPPRAVAARRVGQHRGPGGHRAQRVGAGQQRVDPRHRGVVRGHGQPHRVQIRTHAAPRDPGQRYQVRADRTGHVVHVAPGEPRRPRRGHRARGGLLQRGVGEQPLPGVGQFRASLPAQRHGFQHRGRPLPRHLPGRADVGQPAGVGQRQRVHRGQCGAPGRPGQERDVPAGEGERQVRRRTWCR